MPIASAGVELANWDKEDKAGYRRADELNASNSRIDGSLDVTHSPEVNELDQSVLRELGYIAGPAVEKAPLQVVGLIKISEADEEKEQESLRL